MSGRTPVPGSALHGYRRRATTDHAQLPLSGLQSGQTLVQGLHQTPLSEQPAPGVFISSGGERAGAIAGALVGSPTCSSICSTGAGAVARREAVGQKGFEVVSPCPLYSSRDS